MPVTETRPDTKKEKQRASSFERTLASARSTLVFSEVLRLAFDSFRASKVRFLLTMLGMIIGSASIVLVVTLGNTGKQYALDLLASIGPNMIEMQYNGGSVSGMIVRMGGKYVLETADNLAYQLDDQEKASQYEGKHVKITGTLDRTTGILHVRTVELMS